MCKTGVYLAGPMEDSVEEEMIGWRTLAKQVFDSADIQVYDPTRRISFHDQIGEATSYIQDNVRNQNICRSIFRQDLQDIDHSSVVLADIRRSSGRGTGSSMELMYAYMKGKIIILWANKEDKIHPFYESIYTEKHYDVEDAIFSAVEYFC